VAVRLFEELTKPRDGAGNIGERLVQALPQWCQADKTRAELCTLLEAQFRHQAENAQPTFAEIRLQIEDRCIDFASTKYGDTEKARKFGVMLSRAAWGALDIPQRSQAQVASAILRERERAQKELQKDRSQLESILRRHNVLLKEQKLVAAEILKAEENDPIVELLHVFFSVKERYWRRFFDKRGQPRKRKLPNFPTMREHLLRDLLAPGRPGECFTEWTLTRREAHGLAAICMKAAYHGMFPKSFDGESVRLDLYYHQQMGQRSVSERPRYDRI
jgi:hypothetical protein